MKKFFFSLMLSLLYAICYMPYAGIALAASTNCQPIYGGGQTCVTSGNVSVNKRVVDPVTGALVDNLGINDNKFGPESIVTFQIAVTNTGNTTINNVQVKDIFPQYVDFAAGVGNYDANARILSFDLSNVNPGETRTNNIVGKIVRSDQLPVDRGIVCIVNQATAKDAVDSGNPSQDNVQLCIQKGAQAQSQLGATVVETKGGLKVFPPQKVFSAPATGPEALPLMALVPTSVLGFFLRKKALAN